METSDQDYDKVVFLEIDPDTLSKIIETHTEVKHINQSLEDGKQTFRELGERMRALEQRPTPCFDAHEARIRNLELQQSSLNGKLAIIVIFVGAGITLITNFAISLWRDAWK